MMKQQNCGREKNFSTFATDHRMPQIQFWHSSNESNKINVGLYQYFSTGGPQSYLSRLFSSIKGMKETKRLWWATKKFLLILGEPM